MTTQNENKERKGVDVQLSIQRVAGDILATIRGITIRSDTGKKE